MDFKLSEREELLRKTIREFAEKEIPPRMDAMEDTGDFPVDLLKKMGEMGILGVITPPEYGGNGLGNLARIIVLEELGRVCPAIRSTRPINAAPQQAATPQQSGHAQPATPTLQKKTCAAAEWRPGRRIRRANASRSEKNRRATMDLPFRLLPATQTTRTRTVPNRP